MPAADTAAVMSQQDLERLACRIADKIVARKFGQAAKLIEQLADAVRAVREGKPGS